MSGENAERRIGRKFARMKIFRSSLLGIMSEGVKKLSRGANQVSVAIGDRTRLGMDVVLILFFVSAIGANICYSLAYALEFIFGNDLPSSRWVAFWRRLCVTQASRGTCSHRAVFTSETSTFYGLTPRTANGCTAASVIKARPNLKTPGTNP